MRGGEISKLIDLSTRLSIITGRAVFLGVLWRGGENPLKDCLQITDFVLKPLCLLTYYTSPLLCLARGKKGKREFNRHGSVLLI